MRLSPVAMLSLTALIVAVLTLVRPVHAGMSVLSSGIPDFYSRSNASIVIRGLGPACAAMTSVKYVLPCNPAFTDSRSEKLFAAHLFMGNDASTIREIEQIINGPHTRQFVEDLFKKDRPIEMEASGEFSFRTRWFSAAFTPYRLTYYSAISNRSYPVIALHAMKERTVRGMVGGEIENGTFAGIQIRGVNREFVQNEFTLFDAVTEGELVLERREQNALYFEPGLARVFDYPWKPRVTAYLSNVGTSDREWDEIDQEPILDLGTGVEPPISFGKMDLGLNYRVKRSDTDPLMNLRMAASYSLGMLDAIAGLGTSEWSAGLLTSFWSARVGIVYASNATQVPGGDEVQVQSVYTEFSFVF